MNTLELRRKRAALIEEARKILDAAEAEGRSLTAEEQEQWDRIMADVDAYQQTIEREERLSAYEKELAEPIEARRLELRPVPEGQDEDRAANLPNSGPEYRDAWNTWVRHGKNLLGPEEYRSLNRGTDSAGGYLVPHELERRLIQALEDENVMRTLATVITMDTDRDVPIEEDLGEAYWTAEEAEYTESDATFSQKTLRAHKLTRLMRISEELLQDSAFDLETYVVSNYGRTMGRKEEEAFVAGDGNGKPLGILLDAQVGHTAASATAIAADEIFDLYHSLRRPYRRRATWLANDSTVLALRKLKDNEGRYIWQPSLTAGQPDTLLGRPIVTSNYVPEIGANNRSLVFGDLSYYWVVDRRGRFMQRLGELFAKTGQVGFRAYQRVDGRLILTEAVKVLVHPESSGGSDS